MRGATLRSEDENPCLLVSPLPKDVLPLGQDNTYYLHEPCHVVGVRHILDYEQWPLHT